MGNNLRDLKQRTKAFCAARDSHVFQFAKEQHVAQVLGKQVLRSGTSVGANYQEASRGRSKSEFISKIGDCLREIEEAEYWLELLVDSGSVRAPRMADLLDETRQVNAILTTISKRSKESM